MQICRGSAGYLALNPAESLPHRALPVKDSTDVISLQALTSNTTSCIKTKQARQNLSTQVTAQCLGTQIFSFLEVSTKKIEVCLLTARQRAFHGQVARYVNPATRNLVCLERGNTNKAQREAQKNSAIQGAAKLQRNTGNTADFSWLLFSEAGAGFPNRAST
jgi:hypothetical protein